MNSLLFELCAESLDAALAAEAGGASRIELCSNLSHGGTTPQTALLASVCGALLIPVHVLIRPRPGDFVFSAEEFRLMQEQIEVAREHGASGIVSGVLLPDGRVDVARSRQLFDQARPMATTFHRAFDETPDLFAALEDVIRCGAQNLLSSGGAPEAAAGTRQLALLEDRAAGRIRIMAGGGLRLSNLVEVLLGSGVTALHASLMRDRNGAPCCREELAEDLREALRLMQRYCSVGRASSGAGI